MCGFGGVINSDLPLEREAVAVIAKAVSHRGPDSTGIVLFDNAFEKVNSAASSAFFFNRLAIIDLDPRSNQPFEDDRNLLMFNGEIYNYKEIKGELIRGGIQFKTLSDTEVLFQALKKWGKDAIAKLNGMFAFCWIDKHEKSFLLARDRVGIKPLYYSIENEKLIFASELHTISRFLKQKPKISHTAVQNYLCLQYVPTPYSIFENVYKLPPGHFLKGDIDFLKHKKELKPEEYWNAYHYSYSNTNNDISSNLESILVESVGEQLVADVPLGFFLSSGIDSSLLTAIINKHFRGRPFDFFTIAFDQETISDESNMALNYLNGFNNPDLRHHKLVINSQSISSKFDSLYNYIDEPFGDHASLLNWSVSERAREHATVVLSGDGADEMFWGYPRYNQWRTQQQRLYKKIPGIKLLEHLVNLFPESRAKYTLYNMLDSDRVDIYFNLLRPRLFGFLPSIAHQHELWSQKEIDKIKHRDDLVQMLDVKAYLADAMLYKVDRASMASSLEVRVPYLDNRVIDYALALPLSSKSTAEYNTKAPLKKLLHQLAPHYDLAMPKKGFNFPLEHWLKNEWKDRVLSTVTKKGLEEVGLPGSPYMHIVNQFYNGRVNCAYEIWYLLNLVQWHESFKKIS